MMTRISYFLLVNRIFNLNLYIICQYIDMYDENVNENVRKL